VLLIIFVPFLLLYLALDPGREKLASVPGPYLWQALDGLCFLAVILLVFTRGFQVTLLLRPERIAVWTAWKRWLRRLGIRRFEEPSVRPEEVEKIAFGVEVVGPIELNCDPTFRLWGRTQAVRVPAASPRALEVMRAVLDLCPRAEVTP